ncbi:MAG: hypothetical protein WA101_01330 [Minisyncoccia bacterium]
MKKYIIVSLLVAALFVGISLSVVNAVSTATATKARTISLSTFESNLADGLVGFGVVKAADKDSLKNLVHLLVLKNENVPNILNGTDDLSDPVLLPYRNCLTHAILNPTVGTGSGTSTTTPVNVGLAYCYGFKMTSAN